MTMSRSQIHRKIKALTNLSTSIFIRKIRLYKAKELLRTTDFNISEIAYEVGFKDPNYFTHAFVEEFDITPSATRK
jgi:AraC-like DNA-binding protein